MNAWAKAVQDATAAVWETSEYKAFKTLQEKGDKEAADVAWAAIEALPEYAVLEDARKAWREEPTDTTAA